MATDNQKCPFEIKGITTEKSEWEWNNEENTLVRRWNGNTVYIKLDKEPARGKNKWPRIKLILTFEIRSGKKYPAQERLYRELFGRYGGEQDKYIDDSEKGKWTMDIVDSNEKDIIKEIEENPLLQNSLSELISDVMRYVYKYEAIKSIEEKLKENGISKMWKVKTCFNTKDVFIDETDLAVEHIENKDEKKKYGQPYIDLTQFIDDKWKLWFYTRIDANNGNCKHTDEIINKIAPDKFNNRVWRDGNDYVILDEFADVRDWLCKAERERFIKAVVVKIKYWTEEIITKYIDPQRTQSPEKPQNTTIETK